MTVEQILQEVDKLTIKEIRRLYYALCERLGVSETGVVTGEYAKQILDELKTPPTPEQIKRVELRDKFFQQIAKRSF